MLKVMTLVGTRPELIKMSRVIAELDKQTQHILVHSGQNYDYELNQVFFDDLEIRKPDYFLGAAGDTAAKTISEVIYKADELFEKEQPDALLLYGDTNTCLAVISAKRRKIPVFHMEAGNRCFDQRVPEELNRKVLDHLSDINMVLTEHARRYLLAEGIRPETIIKTGSHMQEVLDYYMPRIVASNILAREGLEAGKFFVVSAHREENVDTPDNLRDLLASLRALADTYQYPIIVSTHPRTRKRLEALGESLDHPLIRFVKPFGLLDYIKLQLSSFCVLSDSGTITEEASLLNFPAVTIRNAHERPEGMDEGT
ncbi:UDP-N-acetylglucosamine 2-epimerase, partial [Pseudomonas sp. ABAC21]